MPELSGGSASARRRRASAASGAPSPAPRRWRRVNLAEAANLKVTIEKARRGRTVRGRCRKPTRKNRCRKKCIRYVKAKTIKVKGIAGLNNVNWA